MHLTLGLKSIIQVTKVLILEAIKFIFKYFFIINIKKMTKRRKVVSQMLYLHTKSVFIKQLRDVKFFLL